MARLLLIVALSLLVNSTGFAQRTEPMCISDLAKMPKSWLPSAVQVKHLQTGPWSKQESKHARHAVETGINEIIEFFARKPSAVRALWDDSIEALIQITYASANVPTLDLKIRNAAHNNLSVLIKTYKNFNREDVTCEEFKKLLPLALFAYRLYSQSDQRIRGITELTNAAYRECYTLEDATGINLQQLLVDNRATSNDELEMLFDAYIWSLWFMEAELFPQIKISKKSQRFASAFWTRLKTLPLPEPGAFDGGVRNERFNTLADLATHVAHIPTAVHRYPLYREDHPMLYSFHRKNFYKIMESGDLDLFASFIDSLRQYGCTPDDDRQVRDGTRYLLKVFRDNGDRWMNYERAGQSDDDLGDYERVHRPWTAMLGIRDRKIQRPNPGTLGSIIRRQLFPAASPN